MLPAVVPTCSLLVLLLLFYARFAFGLFGSGAFGASVERSWPDSYTNVNSSMLYLFVLLARDNWPGQSVSCERERRWSRIIERLMDEWSV